ncbi:hypothetical protein MMC30_005309 [Trapelia coarctata]|nr:hypothetical protein [Trapelia coarctata]
MSSTDVSGPPAYDKLASPVGNGLTNPPPYHQAATPSARAIAIPTFGLTVSPSFPYYPSLADFNISPSDWSLFTADLQSVVAPTKGQQALAVLGGIGTAVLIGGPWASPCVWRWILRKQVIGSVRKGLNEDEDAGCGKAETVGVMLKRWNAAWAEKGVVLGLDISEKGVNMDEAVVHEDVKKAAGDVNDSEGAKKCCGKEKSRFEQKEKCCGNYEVYFRVVVQKVGEADVEEKIDEKKLSVVVSEQDDAMW